MQGKTLGPYRIESELGSGGMGKVWLAEAVERCAVPAGTRVALKVVHPHLLNEPGFFKRFLREAEIGRAVVHPNVVRCHDCDQLVVEGTTHAFLVMEYVEGQTLRGLLDELETVPEELCRHIGREVSKGLAAIHEAGVVHRDLKPENVLITPDHEVKIMDLGVARLADEAIRLSRSGAFVGSVLYASPEHFQKGGEDLDGRADLFSLGVILYELACGAHPHRGDDFASVLAKVVEEKPRRLGERNPQLSAFFEEVVHALLAKDREERFASGAKLLEVLERGERSTWWGRRAKAIRAQTKLPLRRIRIPRETAVYGREDELSKLRALYEKAKKGDGQILLIEGEAGIGKTRLVDEAIGRLRQDGEDLNFLFGSYPPGGAATASGAWSTAYREQFGAEGLEETLGKYLRVTPILVPAFAAVLQGEPPPEGKEPLTKDSLQTVFVHATRALAAERPTVVLIEDLHFAPEEGRAMFASLALAVPEHRILLVGTARPGIPDDWRANLERLDHASRMQLQRLGPKDLAKLLVDAFQSKHLAEELAFKVGEKSDGNPFFVFEIIRGLREGQFITRKADGTWVSTRVIQEIAIPSSVQDLIQARIADLTEEEQELLDVAACCGFEFDAELVAKVLGVGEIPVLRMLGHLVKSHRLVRAAGREFAFDHHQVQESLYSGLSDRLRDRYHAAIGEAMLLRDPEPDGATAVGLCEHLLKGGRGDLALPHLVAALDHLEKSYRNDQAVALADRALAAHGLLEGRERLRVLLRKSHHLDLLSRRGEQRAALDEALDLAEESGESLLRARVRASLGDFLVIVSRYEEAQETLREAIDLSREAGDAHAEAHATLALGNAFYMTARYGEAREYSERSLALFRENDDRQGESGATSSLGLILWDLGRYPEAREHHERSLVLSREIGNLPGEAAASGNVGVILADLGRYEEARARYERQLALSREAGDRRGEAIVLGNLGNNCLNLGQYGEGRELLSRSLALCREIGFPRGEAIAECNLGVVSAALGDLSAAREFLESCRTHCAEIGGSHSEGYALLTLGVLAQQQGDPEAAIRLFEEALDLHRGISHLGGVAATLAALGGLLAEAGHPEEARTRLEEALALGRDLGLPDPVVLASCFLALLPGGVPDDALAVTQEYEPRLGHAGKAQARFLLWRATRDPTHLEEAHRLLHVMRDHAPAECRETMIANVRLHGDILAEWEEHGVP